MSKNRKESCNLHLYLGKKDLEILRWKESLPPRCFKYYMEQILLSYITGQKVMIPTIREGKTEPIICPIHLVITDKIIIEFLEQFDKGEKSKSIKDILTYYIREAKDGQYISRGKKAKKTQIPVYDTPVVIPEKKEPINNIQHKKPQNFEKQQTKNKPQEIEKPKQTTKPNTPQITVETKPKTDNPDNENKAPVKTNSPMVKALLKMSGDE